MKKIISLALSLVLVSSAFAGSCLSARETADGAATQKIGLICSDPGFESGELTTGVPATDGGMGAWNEQQKKEFNAGLSITDEDAATGRYSLKVMTPTWSSNFALGFNVEKNAEFDEKTNLLSNGSFDNKDWWATDWWYCTTGWWGFGKELNGDDGTNCLHIKEVWQGVHYGTSFEAKPYTNYNVTFIYKGNPRWAHARILTMDEKIIADKNVDGNVNLTEWKNFTMSFNSGSEGGKCIFTFVMEPDSEFYVDDVYITPLETNKITVSDSCLSVSVNSAEPGAAVKITAAPETGRRVKSIVLTGDENAGIINADNTVKGIKTVFDSDTGFTMPGYDVTVSAEYTDYTDYNRDGVTDIRDLIRLKKLIAADSGYKNAAEELAMLRKILLGAA